MITNLKELQDYTKRLMEKLPEIKNEILLCSPGCSEAQISQLIHALPNIPESYLRCIRQFNLFGVSIGYFRLWPGILVGDDFIQGLIKTNLSESNPVLQFLQRNGLYEVATWDTAPIAVASRTSNNRNGKVFLINCENDRIFVSPLAKDFEDFLLIAGNLDEIRDRLLQAHEAMKPIEEFSKCLETFHVEKETKDLWLSIGKVVLTCGNCGPV